MTAMESYFTTLIHDEPHLAPHIVRVLEIALYGTVLNAARQGFEAVEAQRQRIELIRELWQTVESRRAPSADLERRVLEIIGHEPAPQAMPPSQQKSA